MANVAYRPDIDGLRAFAVLAVVLFHAGIAALSGGYVGVDVFFVISGFLITGLIAGQVANGTFSFSNFYIRRVRRLFPALAFTLAFCFIGAALLFSPDHFRRAAGAAGASALSVANIYFWQEASNGYFARDAEIKPLLHMWSLSVEEQFYLVWPAALVLLLVLQRRFASLRHLPLIAVVVAGVSSLWLVWAFQDEAETIFYLAPFRAFEFAIGASLVWLVRFQPRRKWLLEPILISGLCAILYSVLVFDRNTPFPGTYALIPCLGTAMAIYAGKARFSGKLLDNPLAVGIGLISYSLYLIHWPLIVFYQYHTAGRFKDAEQLLVIAVGVAAAIFMYRYVEAPFRARGDAAQSVFLPPAAFALRSAALALVIVGVSAQIWTSDGWPWRIDPGVREALSHLERRARAPLQYMRSTHGQGTADFSESRVLKILILGDSHSIDLFNAFHLNEQRFPGMEVRRLPLDELCMYVFAKTMPPAGFSAGELAHCEQESARVRTSNLLREADWIFFCSSWRASGIEALAGFIDYASREHRKRVAIFSKRATFRDVPRLLMRHGTMVGMERVLFDNRKTKIDKLNDRVKEITLAAGATYIDSFPLSCSDATRRCHVANEDGQLLLLDRVHWSVEGAVFFGRRIATTGLLDPIMKTQKLTSSAH